MRASITDRRLEAVAGPVVADLRGPGLVPWHYWTVFVGEYVWRETESASGQITIFPGYTRQTTSPSLDGKHHVSLRQGVEYHGVAGVGRHPLTDAAVYKWGGPMRAVSYTRGLTNAEALAVARHLAQAL